MSVPGPAKGSPTRSLDRHPQQVGDHREIVTEPWEIVYFKIYKSQLPVIEQALETAGTMLGSHKSRGYCLEMICADFLAGANVECDEVESPIAACPHESGLAKAQPAPDGKTNS
jgi:hypothetical protein